MFELNYDFIFEDFLLATNGSNCKSRYILRKMLLRGYNEARFRSRLYAGDKAFDYKRIAYELEFLMEQLDCMFDDDSTIQGEHRITIMKAIKLCQCLLALDQAETNADYDNLVGYLTDDLCDCCREEALAA